jgi:hypothetical protein
MTAARLVTALALVAMLLAIAGMVPAVAMTDAGAGTEASQALQQQDDNGSGTVTRALWTLAGIGVGALALSILYLLKRRVGGFPEDPTWVAPISIMPADENATEESFGETPAHDGHASGH